MIRLTRPPPPPSLTKASPAATKKLWSQWKAGQKIEFDPRVYGSSEVKQALLKAQHGKCAYCETRVVRDYGQVEHYRPKAGWKQKRGDKPVTPGYFWLAFEWTNLCVSCAMCNDAGHKGNLFPLSKSDARATPQDPDHASERPLLLDAFTDHPEQHIGWEGYLPVPIRECPRAKATIQAFRLDEDEALVDERRQILKLLRKVFEAVRHDRTLEHDHRRALIEELRDACRDTSPYAAMTRAAFGSELRRLERKLEHLPEVIPPGSA